MTVPQNPSRLHAWLLGGVGAVFVWSGIECYDGFTWALEVAPAVIGIGVLIYVYPRFRFTDLLYVLIALHAVILMVGGKYTYARMPLFEWLKNALGLERNYYDRVGHFAQGFVPALIARELLLRLTPLARGKLLIYLVLSVALAISAGYELIEFAVAKLTGTAADAFLGTQGDPWDTQWDMTFCFFGATTALILFSGLHDRALAGQDVKRIASPG